jgi:hypothetical protein
MRLRSLVLGLVVVVLVVAGVFWWQGRETAPPPEPPATAPIPEEPAVEVPPPSVATPAPAPSPTGAEPLEEKPALPTLDASDPYVREQLVERSPKLADWLNRDDLVRRFAVVMDNAAVGDVPRRQLAFLAPVGPFMVIASGDDRFVMDPKGYARYDRFVDAFTSVPPEDAAALLTSLAPLLAQALAEVGEPAEEPLATLRDAIAMVLATPELDTPVALMQPKVLYKFVDPTLEALPPLQKQMIRMGPDHVRQIKAYLRKVKAAL